MTGSFGKDGVSQKAILLASSLIAQALDLLDAHGGPPNASAYLALALDELRGTADRQ